MRTVSVSIDVPQSQQDVFDYLDVMQNHAGFNDHAFVDFVSEGPPSGIGARARAVGIAGGRRDPVEFEVVDASPPERIVERNVSAKGKRIAQGTYTLTPTPSGGTTIGFTFEWLRAPLADKVLAPLVHSMMGKSLQRSMERLAAELAGIAASS